MSRHTQIVLTVNLTCSIFIPRTTRRWPWRWSCRRRPPPPSGPRTRTGTTRARRSPTASSWRRWVRNWTVTEQRNRPAGDCKGREIMLTPHSLLPFTGGPIRSCQDKAESASYWCESKWQVKDERWNIVNISRRLASWLAVAFTISQLCVCPYGLLACFCDLEVGHDSRVWLGLETRDSKAVFWRLDTRKPFFEDSIGSGLDYQTRESSIQCRGGF